MIRKCLCVALFSFLAIGISGPLEQTAGQVNNSRRTIPVVGEAFRKVSLPPPCFVVSLNGKFVTVKDFYGKQANLQLADVAGIKIGDKVVVKDGLFITGIIPE